LDASPAILAENELVCSHSWLGWTGAEVEGGEATIYRNYFSTVNSGPSAWVIYSSVNRGDALIRENAMQCDFNAGVSHGVYLTGFANARLADNQLCAGRTSGESIGVQIYQATATLINNVIDAGASVNWTAGVESFLNNTVTMIGNDIFGGSGPKTYGVYVHGEGPNSNVISMVNNVFDSGSGTSASYAMWFPDSTDQAVMLNNDLVGDADCLVKTFDGCLNDIFEINACDWLDCEQAGGNIGADPGFADPASGDYHLTAGSPCIDTGIAPWDWTDEGFAAFDFEGDIRPGGANWDIGADEFMAGRR
jgi:hypothetical protein